MLRRHSQLNLAGAVHFTTTVARHRGHWFMDEGVCRELLEIFEYYRAKFNLRCYGYSLMPDHLHALLMQDAEGDQVSRLMESFKRLTARKIRVPGWTGSSLWREGYDDQPITTSKATHDCLKYIHHNAVSAGLVELGQNHRWSSAPDYYFDDNGGIVVIEKLTFIL